MNRRQLLRSLVAAGFGLALAAIGLVLACPRAQAPDFRAAPKLLAAAGSYSRDLASQGKTWPAEVSAQELAARGYLNREELAAFHGMPTWVTLSAEEEQPEAILVWTRTEQGVFTALMGDGSVQQLPSGRFESLRRRSPETLPTDR